jgi:hypothetical protein
MVRSGAVDNNAISGNFHCLSLPIIYFRPESTGAPELRVDTWSYRVFCVSKSQESTLIFSFQAGKLAVILVIC